jgi:hypothetical protein
MPPVEASNKWRIAQILSVVAVGAVFIWGGGRQGMRGLGILMLVGMCSQLRTRRIPYGWEGREPSGYVTGLPAVLIALLYGAAGVLMLAQPDFMLYLFGWDSL